MSADDDIRKMISPVDGLSGIGNLSADVMKDVLNAPPFSPALSPSSFPKTDHQMASGFHERLKRWITNFEKSLDDESEVGVRLVSFGQSVVFHLDDIGYSNPFLISFTGVTQDGEPVELIQHVNQISILLMKVPRRKDSERKRIGFGD